jgi:hypothetical protein
METTNYLILGFAVIFGALFLHLASLYLRDINLRRDIKMLETLQRRPKKQTPRLKKRSR